MEVKTYRARNMYEALAFVRQDLGRNAHVLESREVRPSGWLGWFPSMCHVEVTALGDKTLRSLGKIPFFSENVEPELEKVSG